MLWGSFMLLHACVVSLVCNRSVNITNSTKSTNDHPRVLANPSTSRIKVCLQLLLCYLFTERVKVYHGDHFEFTGTLHKTWGGILCLFVGFFTSYKLTQHGITTHFYDNVPYELLLNGNGSSM